MTTVARAGEMISSGVKERGAYFTPGEVAQTLVHWAVRRPEDRLLDPSCGDGQFLSLHPNAVGVEWDGTSAAHAGRRSPGSVVHVGDFFEWASRADQRFDCVVGNPPFIRYQRFSGETRQRALALCRILGVRFSALTSSWAPFLAASAGLLKPGGRMAFVVPAEIGHAPYARPLVRFLADRFDRLQLIAIRDRVFPSLSQDVWLMYADGFSGRTDDIRLTTWNRFRASSAPPRAFQSISISRWEAFSGRLRPFLLPNEVIDLYEEMAGSRHVSRLGDVAKVGIGYVTGANDFFHLRPSEARHLRIPNRLLHIAVRSGRSLSANVVDATTIDDWVQRDLPCMLLKIKPDDRLPATVRDYLESAAGNAARQTYKSRNRDPWYCVPDVTVPDGFLSYMSGNGPVLVANEAGCVGTNSVHVVKLRNGFSFARLRDSWGHPLTRLSVEMEGHPLGGGMLKLEPGEAARVLLPSTSLPLTSKAEDLLEAGRTILRLWRHYGG